MGSEQSNHNSPQDENAANALHDAVAHVDAAVSELRWLAQSRHGLVCELAAGYLERALALRQDMGRVHALMGNEAQGIDLESNAGILTSRSGPGL